MKVNLNSQNQYSVSMQAKKLVPLSEYKGVVLKLTAGDKKKIAEIQAYKASLETDLYKLLDFFRRKKISPDDSIRIDKLMAHIDSCDNDIAAIKRQRLDKQIAKINKLDIKA